MKEKSSVRSLPMAVLAIIVYGLVLLLLGEGMVRSAAYLTDNDRGAIFDSELGWRLVPHITKKDFQWSASLPATTNSLGWRDDEFTAGPVPGHTRILALGDSFTFGFGVDYGQRFSEFMEQSSESIEVLNMGVFAYGTDQELLAYQLYGKALRPDIVVINLYLGNDLADIRSNEVHSFPKPYFVMDGSSLNLIKPVPGAWVRARSVSYLAELIFKVVKGDDLDTELAPELKDTDPVELLLALLKRLSVETSEAGARLLVVLIHPRDATVRERSFHQHVVSAIGKSGLEMLDLREVFFENSVRPCKEFYLPDGHWNSNGHAEFARALDSDLRKRGWLPGTTGGSL